MRVLIPGGDGMLGHRLLQHLAPRHDVRVTLRQDLVAYREFGLFSRENAYPSVDVRVPERLLEVLADFQPDAIVNCVGIVKQREEAKAVIPSLEINALLPHRLAQAAQAVGARLIHLSTDCVFSGRRGGYRESDPADAEDLYGKTKHLGETTRGPCLTIRTSIIGRELSRKRALLEWFMVQQSKTVKGFRNAIFSGFTTAEMARIIERLLVEFPAASGLYHVSSDPISKYDLLLKLNRELGLDVTIAPDDDFRCDRSLDSSRFRAEFNYRPPSWDTMVAELAAEQGIR